MDDTQRPGWEVQSDERPPMPNIDRISGDLGSSSPQPTGTVTFLFTDVEGSTSRWEAHRPQMADALARHDAILQEVITSHNGNVFKKVGDEFCAAFSRTTDAALAAIAAQRRLHAQDFRSVGGIKVRMAIHTGEADERDHDYFGPPVNLVARILKLAQGDQVIVSSVTTELIQHEPEAEMRFLDLGSYHVDGVAHDQHIFQLCAPGLREAFPSPSATQRFPNNLPSQLTRLIGREDEVADVLGFLKTERLISIVGEGGLGKTRLAMEVGSQSLGHYTDGVWMIELAPVLIGDFVVSAVSSAINVHESRDRTLTESVIEALKHKNALLIIDNCEHLIGAVAKLIDVIVRVCPGVRILATSRQALGLPGEWIYRLRPLEFPKSSKNVTAEAALRYSSIALFDERARAVSDQYRLTDATAPVVAEICRRLDGIALAIELAAARVKVLSLAHLRERLNERFRLLTGGSRTELPRHQTMRALIDWSYDLLNESEKTIFRNVSIFAGGFSLEAATHVCAADHIDELDVCDLLGSLVEKSLLVVENSGNVERYDLLESTHEYAREALSASGLRDGIARRHGDYYRWFAEDSDRIFYTTPQGVWFSRVKQEYDNFHTALLWSLTGQQDTVLGGAIAGALERLWFDGGHLGEGIAWIDQALAAIDKDATPQVAARLYLARAGLLEGVDKLRAAESACALYESTGDRRGLGYAMHQCALAQRQRSQWDQAEKAAREAVTLLEGIGDWGGTAIALNALASIRSYRGDPDSSRQLHERALSIARSNAIDYAERQANLYLADLEFQCGNLGRAVNYVEETLPEAMTSQIPSVIANIRCNRALYLIALDRRTEATIDAYAALEIMRDAQDHYRVAIALQHIALLAALDGVEDRAARWTAYVDAVFSAKGLERGPTEAWGRARLDQVLRARFSEDRLSELRREGAALTEPEVLEEVLSARHLAV